MLYQGTQNTFCSVDEAVQVEKPKTAKNVPQKARSLVVIAIVMGDGSKGH